MNATGPPDDKKRGSRRADETQITTGGTDGFCVQNTGQEGPSQPPVPFEEVVRILRVPLPVLALRIKRP
jgi:hypothetical protein